MQSGRIEVTWITALLLVALMLPLLLGLGSVVKYLSGDRSSDRLILERIDINGAEHWISLSEADPIKDKPIVLFLHGGPGSANLSLLNQLAPGLRDYAIIVNWDQRNAGKSFSLFQSRQSVSFEQSIEDAHLLTQYLKNKFSVDKISLLGFSAGTALGIMLIDRYPDDYNLFISVAQMVDGQRGEQLSLDYTLQKAREFNDTKAISELEEVKFDFSSPQSILENTQKQRIYLLRYGGVYYNYSSYSHEVKSLWISREYSFLDFLFWPMASAASLKVMWHEVVLMKIDDLVPAVVVPVVFFCGEYDMNNPTILVEEYYDKLIAPQGKEFILFEHSAHGIFWDEPKRFESEVLKALAKYSY
jgi:pimeloyl-ACP methyl ester carboxylesterase